MLAELQSAYLELINNNVVIRAYESAIKQHRQLNPRGPVASEVDLLRMAILQLSGSQRVPSMADVTIEKYEEFLKASQQPGGAIFPTHIR